MKLHFLGEKLNPFIKRPNVYYDNAIGANLEDNDSFIKYLDEELAKNQYRRLENKPNNVFVVLFHKGVVNSKRTVKERELLVLNLEEVNSVDVFVISNMKKYRKITKAYCVNDIEFIHNYLVNNTGTGRLCFPAGSFDAVKGLYRDNVPKPI